MDIDLTAIEARILGCLIEKEATTPDYYPLSLNAITNACNQKTNRHPVMNLSEGDVQRGLDAMVGKRLLWEKTPAGSRVTKYAHRLSNTLGLTYSFARQELAVLCVLMLRGAQTAGEIRSRSGRLYDFSGLEDVEQALRSLTEREDGPYVARLAREPGRKEARYAHLLCGDIAAEDIESEVLETTTSPVPPPAAEARIAALEHEVAALRSELDEIKQQLQRSSAASTAEQG